MRVGVVCGDGEVYSTAVVAAVIATVIINVIIVVGVDIISVSVCIVGWIKICYTVHA
jgi:hypothetical protein